MYDVTTFRVNRPVFVYYVINFLVVWDFPLCRNSCTCVDSSGFNTCMNFVHEYSATLSLISSRFRPFKGWGHVVGVGASGRGGARVWGHVAGVDVSGRSQAYDMDRDMWQGWGHVAGM